MLCEKPFTINEAEAREIVDTARAKKLFVMEAMWTRFFPIMERVRALLAEGAIGEPKILYADFGFKGTFNPEGRLFNPALGGGALLDVGVIGTRWPPWSSASRSASAGWPRSERRK